MGLTRSPRVPSRLRDFAMQLFELIPITSKEFTQKRWWNSGKVYTEWVLCKDILSKLDDLIGNTSNNNTVHSPGPQIMDDLHSLGQRMLPGFQISEYPSSGTAKQYGKWAEDIRTYVMSMNLLMVSDFILINTNDTDNILNGDWVGMQPRLLYYSGRIYDNVQLQFAKSVHHLVFMRPWNQPRLPTPASRVFHEFIWRLSSQNWCWITNVESAKILLEAIQCHKNDMNYRGWLWFEEELFNRCKEVIREPEGA
ncbi:hypothetical protein K435DRAFT_860696 [Dendrothele bispora CBS 962.96]|uniref:Uncharacterized protein n=1 Tax=Dendrothele bispora (strain CBS 962.96) TaxID=1314807 RepID=A0A4V4HFB5_DENBC|nr:hypothetical protein K435DRAFT_860696 [Dendrothele bispora CBS 962.96]